MNQISVTKKDGSIDIYPGAMLLNSEEEDKNDYEILLSNGIIRHVPLRNVEHLDEIQ